MTLLADMLKGSPYQGYAYGYPHKTAYRKFDSHVPLRELWSRENRSALFLYVHVPFCEMRCGFCNLFTQPRPRTEMSAAYLRTLREEAHAVGDALAPARFSRAALGGGTPTFLDVPALDSLFALARDMGLERGVPVSVETSPATATAEKLACLRENGVTRISIGIQSFVEAEVAAAARPQSDVSVTNAFANLRSVRFPILNVDLIYGLPGQTVASWLTSLETALLHGPDELFLYPLYVRPLTGLDRSGRHWDDLRLDCYRAGRDLLLKRGFEQVSMRFFRRPASPAESLPRYCCQEDGMVGLGCGARSYAGPVHYSREFAVAARGVRAILADYVTRSAATFRAADYGFTLDVHEARRRHLIQSLLASPGLDRDAYVRRFGADPLDHHPELCDLVDLGLAEFTAQRMALTPTGLERSDVIGPWLYSERVRTLMSTFDLH